jgi:hypothetical protein
MEHDSSSNSSSSTSTTMASPAIAASKKLQRRLNGLGRSHWGVKTDIELLVHLPDANDLPHLDILSDCVVRMAEHVSGANARESEELSKGLTAGCGYTVFSKGVG